MAIVVVATGVAVATARADEGGVPFWSSGQYAGLAATPAAPGWSIPTQIYYYDGDAARSQAFTRGNFVTLGLQSTSPLLLFQPTYSPRTKVLGGQLSLGVGLGYGRNIAVGHIAASPHDAGFRRSDTIHGFDDVDPVASLAWTDGAHNWMTYLTGDIPVGDYDSNRLANLGIGHGAIDAGAGYTYYDEKSGHEFSAVVGITCNSENTDTNYKNGIDSHLDWDASAFIDRNWEIGVAGYVYYQLTGDSGAGAKLGPFKSKVAAIGPEIGYTFAIGGASISANIRGYWEFWAENRVEGYAIFATAAIPLGN